MCSCRRRHRKRTASARPRSSTPSSPRLEKGDFEALLAVLDPDVVLRADEHAVELGAAEETRGANAVAVLSRYARGARRALLDGAEAAVWTPGGQLRAVWSFTIARKRITAIELIADPARIRELDLVIPDT